MASQRSIFRDLGWVINQLIRKAEEGEDWNRRELGRAKAILLRFLQDSRDEYTTDLVIGREEHQELADIVLGKAAKDYIIEMPDSGDVVFSATTGIWPHPVQSYVGSVKPHASRMRKAFQSLRGQDDHIRAKVIVGDYASPRDFFSHLSRLENDGVFTIFDLEYLRDSFKVIPKSEDVRQVYDHAFEGFFYKPEIAKNVFTAERARRFRDLYFRIFGEQDWKAARHFGTVELTDKISKLPPDSYHILPQKPYAYTLNAQNRTIRYETNMQTIHQVVFDLDLRCSYFASGNIEDAKALMRSIRERDMDLDGSGREGFDSALIDKDGAFAAYRKGRIVAVLSPERHYNRFSFDATDIAKAALVPRRTRRKGHLEKKRDLTQSIIPSLKACELSLDVIGGDYRPTRDTNIYSDPEHEQTLIAITGLRRSPQTPVLFEEKEHGLDAVEGLHTIIRTTLGSVIELQIKTPIGDYNDTHGRSEHEMYAKAQLKNIVERLDINGIPIELRRLARTLITGSEESFINYVNGLRDHIVTEIYRTDFKTAIPEGISRCKNPETIDEQIHFLLKGMKAEFFAHDTDYRRFALSLISLAWERGYRPLLRTYTAEVLANAQEAYDGWPRFGGISRRSLKAAQHFLDLARDVYPEGGRVDNAADAEKAHTALVAPLLQEVLSSYLTAPGYFLLMRLEDAKKEGGYLDRFADAGFPMDRGNLDTLVIQKHLDRINENVLRLLDESPDRVIELYRRFHDEMTSLPLIDDQSALLSAFPIEYLKRRTILASSRLATAQRLAHIAGTDSGIFTEEYARELYFHGLVELFADPAPLSRSKEDLASLCGLGRLIIDLLEPTAPRDPEGIVLVPAYNQFEEAVSRHADSSYFNRSHNEALGPLIPSSLTPRTSRRYNFESAWEARIRQIYIDAGVSNDHVEKISDYSRALINSVKRS